MMIFINGNEVILNTSEGFGLIITVSKIIKKSMSFFETEKSSNEFPFHMTHFINMQVNIGKMMCLMDVRLESMLMRCAVNSSNNWK